MYKVTSKITFDVLYFYEKRRSDVFHSKIDLRMAPKECQSQIQYFLFFFLFFFACFDKIWNYLLQKCWYFQTKKPKKIRQTFVAISLLHRVIQKYFEKKQEVWICCSQNGHWWKIFRPFSFGVSELCSK